MYLDALANGLEVLGVHSLISHFPDQFKQAFVSDGSIKPDDVITLLKPEPMVSMMNENEYRLWNYLKTFLYKADNKGKSMHIHYGLWLYNNSIVTKTQ